MIGKEGVVVAMDKTKYWSFAIDDEEFYTPTLYMRKEDAINAGMEDARDVDGKTIFVGQVNVYKPDVARNVNDLIEILQDDAFCDAGEFAEGYLDDVSHADAQELGDMLQDAFNKWLHKHPGYKPHFFTITDSEAYQVCDEEA